MTDFLPLELDVEQVTIERVGNRGEWQLALEREDEEDLYVVLAMPDGLFEQMCDTGDLIYDEDKGRIVQA